MILAAGRGERLRPLTDQTPKPLIEVAGKPLIEHQIGWLKTAGIRDVIINLHHLGEQIEDTLGDGSNLGTRIQYVRENRLLDTGGGVLNALPLLVGEPGDENFLILNGDIWTDYDFSRLLSPQIEQSLGPTSNTLAHLVLTPTPAYRLNQGGGDFDLVADRVVREAKRSLVYCGIGVLSPRLFKSARSLSHVSEAGAIQPFSLAELYFDAADQRNLGGEVHSGHWTDIGSPEQLAAIQNDSR